ncbi:hypothetical protein HDR67_03435, partial [bacterium]|nr:hypothetical protein [bacterium]
MDKIRKRKKRFIGINCLIGMLIAVVMLFGFYHIGFVVLGMFLICFWIFGAVAYYHFKITISYKTEIIAPILKEMSPTLTYAYKEDCTIYKSLIKQYRLIPSATSFTGNDSIRDTVDDIPYLSMDFCATHTQSNGKSSQTIIDFKGKLYDITLGKTYCNFILKEDGAKKG